MAQKKKNIGKRERDRLKKRKAKTVVPVNPESPPSDTDSPPDEPPVPGLDVANYSRVSNLSANMDMGGQVVEKVAVDPNGRKLRVIMGGEKVMNEFSRRMDEENEVQAKLNYVAAKFNAVRAAVFGSAGAKELPEAEQTKARDELRQVVDDIGSLMKSRLANRLTVGGQRKTLYSDGMKLFLNREEPGYKAPSLKRDDSLRKAFAAVERKMDDVFSRVGGKP